MPLTVVETSETLTFLALEGPMNLASVQEIESEFRALTAARKKPVILDLAKVDFIASMGMRLLVEACKSLAPDGKKVAVFNAQPSVARILVTAGMDNVLVISPDEAAARAAVVS